MAEPLIIELRCNETAYKTDRLNLPYSPEEIIRDAVEGREAGASILHWHGRDSETGEPKNDLDLYEEVYRGVREEADLLLHPTLGYITQMDVEERVRHVLAVNGDPALRVDLAPVDFGSINVDYWDPEKKDFATKDLVYYNPRGRLEATLRVFKEASVHVSTVAWNVGQMRTARCFQEIGLLSQETIWEFVFTGGVMPEGMAPSLNGLLAMIEQVPAGRPWSVICWNGDVMNLAAWAITLGGHVSIGLGDHHYDRFGTPTNAELVGRVAEMAETLGRPVATPEQAREIIGLPARG